MAVNEQTIACPKCGQSIVLNDALSEQIKHQLEQELKLKAESQNLEIAKKLSSLKAQEEALAKHKLSMEQDIEAKLKKREETLIASAEHNAKQNIGIKMQDLENQNQELVNKINNAQQKELDLLKEKRELEDKKRELQLEVQRKLEEGQNTIYQKAKQEVEATMTTKLAETQKQLEMTNKALEEARRKGEQGSMQIQGEVQEEDLKKAIIASFPLDIIEDVPPGIQGADIIQTVRSDFGQTCGVIIWESKNTKAWSDDWTKKLKDDRGIVDADECILVTRSMPQDIEHFGKKSGVWVADYRYALALAATLRLYLADISHVKASMVGRDQKVEQLYSYISGNQFRHRLENIVTAFESMQSDLNSEKRAMVRIWNKRSKEIDRVILNTSALWGELQGITSLPSINQLELPVGLDDDEEIIDNS